MKQVLQSFKNGSIEAKNLPISNSGKERLLIRNTASLLSVGTERAVADFSKQSLLGKARSRPDLVKQVMQKVKNEGLSSAWKTSMARLDVPLALGYSCAGEVLVVGEGIRGISVGDRVACAGGGYASHAEVNLIPKNLFVKVPDGVTDEEAAFATVGSVGLQGIRLAELKLGEKVVVIGLGLIGLLTVQMVQANGCRVLGVDLNSERVKLALELGADKAVHTEDALAAVQEFTSGRGADAVLITAATSSNQPIELAGELSRLKGRVVAVGDVKMDIPRRIYYNKELELKVSMSYGPGRYDLNYEEKGIDYPYAYVPFTEQRNLETFLHLVKEKKVTPAKLVTHRFPLEQAKEAYQLIKGETKEKCLGVVFTYPDKPDLSKVIHLKEEKERGIKIDQVRVGVFGAGNYAQLMLLPNLKQHENVNLIGLCTATGMNARHSGDKYDFNYCTTDETQILDDDTVNAVVIATRHNTHAPLVAKALEAGKHVFVEKPLAITDEQLEVVIRTADKSENIVMVGFNRRFSPLGQEAQKFFMGHSQPLSMIYRVNAGFIPREHWTQDPEEGGGRVIGEVCHFVDFLQFICGAEPVAVSATGVLSSNLSAEDNLSINIRFADGSLGSIHYFANGSKKLSKEYIEIFGEEKVFIIDDFRKGKSLSANNVRKLVSRNQDKGQDAEIKAYVDAVKEGKANPIPLKQSVMTTLTTFRILDALKTRREVEVGWSQSIDES